MASSVVNDALTFSIPRVQKITTADLLFTAAQRMGLEPRWMVKGGLFAVATPSGEQYINHTRSPLNPQLNAGLARNKYHSRLVMERHGMPNIPFAKPATHVEAEHFLSVHKTVVAKPVEGQGSRDIHIIQTALQLRELDVKKYILEKYIRGDEMRYLVLNNKVIAVQRSEYGISVAADRSLKRITFTQDAWDPHLKKLSKAIGRAFGLKFIAVDYLIDARGRAYILEINTVPGLKWFHAPTSGPSTDVASQFLKACIQQTA